jgi:hypothetical protein
MATATSASLAPKASLTSSAAPAKPGQTDQKTGLMFEIKDFFRQFIVAAFDPYRPEVHYMRGPGPACRAKRRINS